MIIEARKLDLGTRLQVGRKLTEIDIPRGGAVEFSLATHDDGRRRDGFVLALVRNANGTAVKEVVIDERGAG